MASKKTDIKKLIRLGIPTKCGGKWAESTVGSILTHRESAVPYAGLRGRSSLGKSTCGA